MERGPGVRCRAIAFRRGRAVTKDRWGPASEGEKRERGAGAGELGCAAAARARGRGDWAGPLAGLVASRCFFFETFLFFFSGFIIELENKGFGLGLFYRKII